MEHSDSPETIEDCTGTKYNIQIIAEHPLKIDTGAPAGDKILREIETAIGQSGIDLIPIAAQVERMDEAWGTFESEGWMRRMPEALVMALAKALDGFKAQADDPESDVDVIFDEEHPSVVTIAAAMVGWKQGWNKEKK